MCDMTNKTDRNIVELYSAYRLNLIPVLQLHNSLEDTLEKTKVDHIYHWNINLLFKRRKEIWMSTE